MTKKVQNTNSDLQITKTKVGNTMPKNLPLRNTSCLSLYMKKQNKQHVKEFICINIRLVLFSSF